MKITNDSPNFITRAVKFLLTKRIPTVKTEIAGAIHGLKDAASIKIITPAIFNSER
jgi:hypothetical protein